MILIRYLLIGIIIYLIFRSFSGKSSEEHSVGQQPKRGNDIPNPQSKKVSGKIGEYVDYEEIKDKP